MSERKTRISRWQRFSYGPFYCPGHLRLDTSLSAQLAVSPLWCSLPWQVTGHPSRSEIQGSAMARVSNDFLFAVVCSEAATPASAGRTAGAVSCVVVSWLTSIILLRGRQVELASFETEPTAPSPTERNIICMRWLRCHARYPSISTTLCFYLKRASTPRCVRCAIVTRAAWRCSRRCHTIRGQRRPELWSLAIPSLRVSPGACSRAERHRR